MKQFKLIDVTVSQNKFLIVQSSSLMVLESECIYVFTHSIHQKDFCIKVSAAQKQIALPC